MEPDIVHCQGWFSSLVPMYLKKLYSEDPLFENVKIIYSVFDNSFPGILSNDLTEKLLFEDLESDDVDSIKKLTSQTYTNLLFAIQMRLFKLAQKLIKTYLIL